MKVHVIAAILRPGLSAEQLLPEPLNFSLTTIIIEVIVLSSHVVHLVLKVRVGPVLLSSSVIRGPNLTVICAFTVARLALRVFHAIVLTGVTIDVVLSPR